MTKHEAAIVTAYTGFVIGNFGDAHEYIEKIMGRPVWTHEMANEEIAREIRKKSKADFIAIKVE